MFCCFARPKAGDDDNVNDDYATPAPPARNTPRKPAPSASSPVGDAGVREYASKMAAADDRVAMSSVAVLHAAQIRSIRSENATGISGGSGAASGGGGVGGGGGGVGGGIGITAAHGGGGGGSGRGASRDASSKPPIATDRGKSHMGPVIMAAGPGLGFGASGIDIRPGSGAGGAGGGGGGGGLDERPSSAGPTTIQQHMQHHQQLHQHQQHYAAAVGSRAVNSAGSVSYLNAMPGRQRIVAWLEESDQSFATVDETTNEPVRLRSPRGKQAEGDGESGRDGSADAAAMERLGLFLSSLPAGQYEDRGSPTAAPPSASGESSGGVGGPSGAWSTGGGAGGSSSTGTHGQSGYSAMATAGSGATGPSYTSPGIPGGGFTGAGLSGARRASPNNSKRDLLPPPVGGHSGGAGGGGGSGGNPLGGNPMARTRSSQEPVRLVPQMGSAEESAQAGAAPSPLPATAGSLGAGPSGAGGARGAGVLAPSLSFANGVGSGTGAGGAGGAGVGAGTGLGPGASVGVGGGTGSGAGGAGGAGGAKEKESLRVQALSNAIRHSSHGGEKDRDSHRDKELLGRSTTQYSEEGGSAAAVAGSAVAATAGFGGSARGLGGGFASDTASDTAAGQVHMRDGSFPPSPAPDKSWYAVSPLVDFHPGSSPPPPFMPGQSPLRDSAFKVPLPAVGGNGAGNSRHEGLGEIRTEDGQIGEGGTGDGDLSMDGGKGGAAEGSSHEEAPCSKSMN